MSTKPAPKPAAAAKEAAAPAEKAPSMVKIKMLRSHPRLGYSEGDEGEIPQTLYDELIADGPFFEKI